jgi:hypothetical protein
MNAISITLETLSNGTLRATGRHRGTTIAYRDGFDARELVGYVMKEAALGHQLPSGSYDLTHININAEALAALA